MQWTQHTPMQAKRAPINPAQVILQAMSSWYLAPLCLLLFFFPFSAGFRPYADLLFGLSLCLMFSCGSLHLLSSATKGSLSDDYTARYGYMSIAKLSLGNILLVFFYPKSLFLVTYKFTFLKLTKALKKLSNHPKSSH